MKIKQMFKLMKMSFMQTFLMARVGQGNVFKNMEAAVNSTMAQANELNNKQEDKNDREEKS